MHDTVYLAMLCVILMAPKMLIRIGLLLVTTSLIHNFVLLPQNGLALLLRQFALLPHQFALILHQFGSGMYRLQWCKSGDTCFMAHVHPQPASIMCDAQLLYVHTVCAGLWTLLLPNVQ